MMPQDYQTIFYWTKEKFGLTQARIYAETISNALKDLRNGPEITGVKMRDEIGADIKTLHIARKGRKGRHFVLFRTRLTGEHKVIEVLRLLHDSMDLVRHLLP
jgi:toxin ParE1/3/4